MRVKQRLLIIVRGITLGVGAANAQVVVHGAPPAVIVERPGPPLHAEAGSGCLVVGVRRIHDVARTSSHKTVACSGL